MNLKVGQKYKSDGRIKDLYELTITSISPSLVEYVYWYIRDTDLKFKASCPVPAFLNPVKEGTWVLMSSRTLLTLRR